MSKIEWCEITYNPVSGCTPISPGCDNCYAKKMAERLQRMGTKGYEDGFKVTLHPDKLDVSFKGKPKRIFVGSMGDLFHEDVPFEFIDKVGGVISRNPQHEFLILTKRPDRMREYFAAVRHEVTTNPPYKDFNPLPNVKLGVTVEGQPYVWRVGELLKIPAAGYFVSVEPMLGPVDVEPYLPFAEYPAGPLCPKLEYPGLDLVIFGCESGPNRRPCDIEWIRDGVQQTQQAGVAAFVKQIDLNGKVSKNMDEWSADLRVRQWPERSE